MSSQKDTTFFTAEAVKCPEAVLALLERRPMLPRSRSECSHPIPDKIGTLTIPLYAEGAAGCSF